MKYLDWISLTGTTLWSHLHHSGTADISLPYINQIREECRYAPCSSFWPWALHHLWSNIRLLLINIGLSITTHQCLLPQSWLLYILGPYKVACDRLQSFTHQLNSTKKLKYFTTFNWSHGVVKVKTKSMVHICILPLFDWYQVEISAEPFWRRCDHKMVHPSVKFNKKI